jgi:hypothetical protein
MIIPWNLHIIRQFSCFTSIRNPIKTSLNTIHIWIFHGFSIIFHENPMNAPRFTRWCCFPRPGARWSAHRWGPAWPKRVGRGAGDAGRPHARGSNGGNEGWRKGEIWDIHGILMENPWNIHIWWYLMRF